MPAGLRPCSSFPNGKASSAAHPERRLAALAALLGEHAAGVTGRVTGSEPELREALEEADGRRVVLVGGDGTLHAAVNAGIALPEVALIPAGRANNVARALGIPDDLASAALAALLFFSWSTRRTLVLYPLLAPLAMMALAMLIASSSLTAASPSHGGSSGAA